MPIVSDMLSRESSPGVVPGGRPAPSGTVPGTRPRPVVPPQKGLPGFERQPEGPYLPMPMPAPGPRPPDVRTQPMPMPGTPPPTWDPRRGPWMPGEPKYGQPLPGEGGRGGPVPMPPEAVTNLLKVLGGGSAVPGTQSSSVVSRMFGPSSDRSGLVPGGRPAFPGGRGRPGPGGGIEFA